MKKLWLVIILCAVAAPLYAQVNADSVAYEHQRAKINSLLALRKQKFGQYDVSLTKKTGIFGWQTKKDIRRSNEILMDIVQADNNIFKELKILLDYRTFQQTQAQTQVQEREKDRLAYINTINRLRKQHEDLKAKVDEQAQEQQTTTRTHTIAIIILLGVCVLLFVLLTKQRAKNSGQTGSV
ncbi:hypothetical protein [Mucilaginibacter hurinus]|uniref:hypothetical protein n=1 Tax=Mucilaginibacter hurinus TaxID=2201324 RepID=UPI0018F3546D|nr:hypothetical protein [Mucilaginibacter hurinus]